MNKELRVVVYSDNGATRRRVLDAVGRRPDPALPELDFVEVATYPALIAEMDTGGVDLAVLDGEATPAGGLGVARQFKDELSGCPPLVVLTGRAADGWLAKWSRAEAAVGPHVGPVELAETVVDLLIGHPNAECADRSLPGVEMRSASTLDGAGYFFLPTRASTGSGAPSRSLTTR